jgi:ankyrin repeat protein
VPLHGAAAGGHEETVKLLLELGANVHAHTKDGQQTPLHVAIATQIGHVETVHMPRGTGEQETKG